MQNYLYQLQQLIIPLYEMNELDDLIFALGLDRGKFPGPTKNDIIRQLVIHLDNIGRLPNLITQLRQERSHITWPDPPSRDFFRRHPHMNMNAENESIEQIRQQNLNVDVDKIFNDETKLLNKSERGTAQQNTDWTGYLLDYSLSHRSKFKEIEDICMGCIESFDLQPLLKALNHPNNNIRKFAAKVLGEIGSRYGINDASIVSALMSTIKASDQDIETKRRAVWALGAIRPSHPEAREKAREILRSLLVSNSEDTPTRWRAAWGLGELKANEEASILAHFASNPAINVDIRRAAVRSLGVLKASKYRKQIVEIANKNGNKLGQIAAWSLSEIDNTSK